MRTQSEPNYIDEILSFADEKEISEKSLNNNDKDELYQSALDIIRTEQKASTSFLQRKLQIGYNRAARIVDMMEEEGVVSKANQSEKEKFLMKNNAIIFIFFFIFLSPLEASIKIIIINLENTKNFSFNFKQVIDKKLRKEIA